MLDEFTSAAGDHRKDAIRVPKNQVQVQNPLKRKTKNYRTIHGREVVQALEQIREIYGHICSKRLQPFLPKPFECWSVARRSSFPQKQKTCSPWRRPLP